MLQGARITRRFIPACAGNAAFDAWSVQSIAVHPRVCGERIVLEIMCYSRKVGSSPRVRGTLQALSDRASLELGSSPRVRGTLDHACQRGDLSPVHPRVCGEHSSPNTRA